MATRKAVQAAEVPKEPRGADEPAPHGNMDSFDENVESFARHQRSLRTLADAHAPGRPARSWSDQWRTAIILIILALLMLVAFFFALHSASDIAERIFSSCTWSLVALGGFAAGKGAIEHASGAAASIFSPRDGPEPRGPDPRDMPREPRR